MKPPKLLRTVYLRAIKVLRKRGWYRGNLSNGEPGGPVCVLGAINVVMRGRPDAPSRDWERDPAWQLLRSSIPENPIAVGSWNDSRRRKRSDVIGALLRAAKAAGRRRVTP